MKQEPEETILKELFQQLKQDDERHAPSFAGSWAAALARLTPRGQHWRGWRFSLAAACVLLVAGAFFWSWRTFGARSTKSNQQARTAATPTPSAPTAPPPAPVLASEGEAASMPAEPRPRRRVQHRTIENDSAEADVLTQFFPLREGVDLTALGSEQLVRMELPGSALSEAGFLVDFETARTSVKADVVLGHDGLARAIRFVR